MRWLGTRGKRTEEGPGVAGGAGQARGSVDGMGAQDKDMRAARRQRLWPGYTPCKVAGDRGGGQGSGGGEARCALVAWAAGNALPGAGVPWGQRAAVLRATCPLDRYDCYGFGLDESVMVGALVCRGVGWHRALDSGCVAAARGNDRAPWPVSQERGRWDWEHCTLRCRMKLR